jgi:transcriptional regulator with XRE-family HTH domain
MEIKEKIGTRIRDLRQQKSMSQKDLAYEADLDRSYIASVEKMANGMSQLRI